MASRIRHNGNEYTERTIYVLESRRPGQSSYSSTGDWGTAAEMNAMAKKHQAAGWETRIVKKRSHVSRHGTRFNG